MLEAKSAQAAAGLRSASTFLTDKQLREAEGAFHRLNDSPKSLTFLVDFGMSNYRTPDLELPLSEAVAQYIQHKTREYDQNLLSISQLAHISRHLAVLTKTFPGVLVSLS